MKTILRSLWRRAIISLGYFLLIESGIRLIFQEQFVDALMKNERYRDAKRLNRYEGQCFSRHGQDGIIAEIFRRIGFQHKTFVEVGCGNGLENNTAYLLLKGWSGFWFDGGESEIAECKKHCGEYLKKGVLKVQGAMLTKENIGEIFRKAGVPLEFDLLSVDVDRNTYQLLEALRDYKPRVIVVEYNSSILPADEWIVEYDPAKVWNNTFYFGASLKSLEILGDRMGYSLVGCEILGADAFFVRKDLIGDHFCQPYTAENHYEPPRFYLVRRNGHRPSFIG